MDAYERAQRDYAAVHGRGEAIWAAAESEDRELTEAEEVEMQKDVIGRGKTLAATIEKLGHEVVPRVCGPTPINKCLGGEGPGFLETRGHTGRNPGENRTMETTNPNAAIEHASKREAEDARIIRHYEGVFRSMLTDEQREVRAAPAEVTAACMLEKATGRVELCLREWRAQGELDPLLGGNLVGSEHSTMVWPLASPRSVIMRLGATVTKMESDMKTMARVTALPDIDVDTAENTTIPDDEVELVALNLVARMRSTLVKSSRQLLDDASNAGQVILDAITQSMALAVDTLAISKILAGAGNTTAVGGAISLTHLATALTQVEVDNEVANGLVMHPSINNALRLKAGGVELAWLKFPPDVDQLQKELTSNTTLGTTNVIIGDFSKLLLGIRLPLELMVSQHAGDAFSKFQVHTRGVWRGDAIVARPDAFATLTGTTV